MKKTLSTLLVILLINTISIGQETYIPYNYKDYIVSQLSSNTYVKGGEEVARNAASKFINLYEEDTFKFGTYFSFDDVTGTCEIYSDKMPYRFSQLNWKGRSEGISSNIWGQYTGKDEAYYNTLIFSWTKDYIKKYPPTEESNTACWIELFKNVSMIYFNDNSDLCWSKWREVKGVELRKAKLIQYTKECIANYMRVRDKGELVFIDYDKVKNLKIAVETNDWEKIESAANMMGWTYDSYLNYQ